MEDLYAIMAATPKNRDRSFIAAEELTGAPLILPNRPHVLRDLVDELNFKRLVIVEVGALSMMVEMAKSGKAHTILPRSAVDSALATGGLVALPIHEPNPSWEVSVCYSKVRPLSSAAEIVLKLLRTELRPKVRVGEWQARLVASAGR